MVIIKHILGPHQFALVMNTVNSAKSIIKRGLQYVAATFGPHTRNNKDPQLLILMYHRILPLTDERAALEEPGMVVSPASFKAHIIALSQYFEFVVLSDWLERRANGLHIPAKACAITFDDGWADNFEFAFPILQSLQVPATIFIVADMIGTSRIFWPEQLAQLAKNISSKMPNKWSDPVVGWLKSAKTDFKFGDIEPTTEQISQLVAYAKKYTDKEIYNRLREAEEKLDIITRQEKSQLLNWEQILTMTHSGLIEIGSHTCNHIRLNEKISNEVVKHEIAYSKNIIKQNTGQIAKTFCFPNGDYSDYALKLVKENYLGAVTTEAGWNLPRTNNYLLRRIGVHEDISANRTAFLACISGWL
jgi:peptidoglycan/xylan/chitin deacetylase (PgdA/CDA1 family)